MQKKLIFLRKGYDDAKQLYKIDKDGNRVLKPKLGIDGCIIDIDADIYYSGYENAVGKLNNVKNTTYEWHCSTCPTILSDYDNNRDPMWWNEEEYKWEIYFVDKGRLKNISEYTEKELRKAHNIERFYLNGGLD